MKQVFHIAAAAAVAIAFVGCASTPKADFLAAKNGQIYYFTETCPFATHELGANNTVVCKNKDGVATGEVLTPATKDEMKAYWNAQEAKERRKAIEAAERNAWWNNAYRRTPPPSPRGGWF